jgi:hypothetical protein
MRIPLALFSVTALVLSLAMVACGVVLCYDIFAVIFGF